MASSEPGAVPPTRLKSILMRPITADRFSLSGPRIAFCTKLASFVCARRVDASRAYASVICLSRFASSLSTLAFARPGTSVNFWPTSGQEIVATCAPAALVRFWPEFSSCAEA